MVKSQEQPNMETAKTPSLQDLELKANFNPEQRAYLEVLKDKMKKILGGKTKQELAKAGDLRSLNRYKSILQEILKFLETKVMKSSIIDVTTPEGENVEYNLNEELKKSEDFFEEQGVDWVSFPEEIGLTDKQVEEFKRCVREFGFNRVLVFPAGLFKLVYRLQYEKLMAKHFRPTVYEEDSAPSAAEKEKRQKLRLILYRDQEGLDNLYLKTRGQGADALLAGDGFLSKSGLEGLSVSEFLAIQQRYFIEHGDYMYFGEEILLLGNEKFHTDTDRVVSAHWQGMDDNRSPKGLGFDGLRSNIAGVGVGAPLVKSFEIE